MTKASKAAKRQAQAARDLSEIPAARLQAELARRQRRVRALLRRRDRLLESARALGAEVAALGGSIAGPARGLVTGPPRNEVNLVQALKVTMGDRTLGVSEAADAVLKGGYHTTPPLFRQIVNSTLIRSNHFERVGRGRYRVK